MSEIRIIVKLKAPDPEAITAMSTLRRISPDICPDGLQRYDHWSFTGPEADEGTVREAVSQFTDIVNPNKQSWTTFQPGECPRGPDRSLKWTGVLVSDRVDSVSENWTRILRRMDPGIERVRYSVLWLLGFSRDIHDGLACERAMSLAVTTHRDSGLLANPVSQEIELLEVLTT